MTMTIADQWAIETEQKVLDAALGLAPDLGWNAALVKRAAAACGLSDGDAELLFPHGARDLAALLSRRHDSKALEALSAVDPLTLKVRERISRALEARLDAAAADEAAVRRWAGMLASPLNAPLALKLVWESADHLWRWAGDVAADENHYSKRAILSGILVSALAVRLSGGREEQRAFVASRIDNVMAFEKWKAGIKPSETAKEIVGALARMRYGRV
jgi:ubiquinone biosynthesis protein COQ9